METVFVKCMFGFVQFLQIHCKSRSCAITLSLAFIVYQQDFYDQILCDTSQIGIVSEWKEVLCAQFIFHEISIFYEELYGSDPIELFCHC